MHGKLKAPEVKSSVNIPHRPNIREAEPAQGTVNNYFKNHLIQSSFIIIVLIPHVLTKHCVDMMSCENSKHNIKKHFCFRLHSSLRTTA